LRGPDNFPWRGFCFVLYHPQVTCRRFLIPSRNNFAAMLNSHGLLYPTCRAHSMPGIVYFEHSRATSTNRFLSRIPPCCIIYKIQVRGIQNEIWHRQYDVAQCEIARRRHSHEAREHTWTWSRVSKVFFVDVMLCVKPSIFNPLVTTHHYIMTSR